MAEFNIKWYDFAPTSLPTHRLRGSVSANILIVAAEEDILQHLTLLERIIESVGCNLDTDTVYLGLQEGETVTVLSPAEPLEYTKILCFGIDPDQVNCPEIKGNPVLFYEKLSVVFGPSLEMMSTNQMSKRELWNSLKQVFNIDS